MKHSFVKWIIGGMAVAAFAITAGVQSPSASAKTLADGTYRLPVKLLKKGSTSTSIANKYFTQTGKAVVSGTNTQVTVTTNGSNYIKGMTANGTAVTESNQSGNNADLTFNLTSQADLVPVSFKLHVLGMDMTQSAQFKLDWANAKLTSTPAATTTPETTTTTPVGTTLPTVTETKPTTTTKKTTKKAAKKTTAKTVWRYKVLQGDSNKTSEANNFYTHVASVKKAGKYYRVAFKVAYKKSLKMGPKGVTPLTMNGKKISSKAIKYGSTKNYYTVVYYYHVKSLNTLKKINRGTIHVKVPTVGISSTFKIRFKFTKSTTKATKASASVGVATPIAASETKASKSASKSASKLPQTGDKATTKAASLGLAGVVTSVVLGSAALRRGA